VRTARVRSVSTRKPVAVVACARKVSISRAMSLISASRFSRSWDQSRIIHPVGPRLGSRGGVERHDHRNLVRNEQIVRYQKSAVAQSSSWSANQTPPVIAAYALDDSAQMISCGVKPALPCGKRKSYTTVARRALLPSPGRVGDRQPDRLERLTVHPRSPQWHPQG
jgi:hypothetical protein